MYISVESLLRMGAEENGVRKPVVGTIGQYLVFVAKPGCRQPQGTRPRESGLTSPHPPPDEIKAAAPPSRPGVPAPCMETSLSVTMT